LRRFTRRSLLAAAGGLLLDAGEARAFGQEGTFNPRLLTAGGAKLDSARAGGPAQWAMELVRRTSAPARLVPGRVAADAAGLLTEPFALWAGSGELSALSGPELRGLERFVRLGGVLVVDDLEPGRGAFTKTAKRELNRVLPDAGVVKLDANHVVYKTYYIVDRPVGRVLGPPQIEAIVRGRYAQVLFLQHDLMGALARTRPGGDGFSLEVEPGGAEQREEATRFAVNIAMYVLCSDYKDDQVHAPWLMRRRAGRRP
jgi:hypothetical protein